MEYYWTLFNNSNNASTTASQGQNCNNTHPPAWDLPTSTTSSASRPDLGYYPPPSAAVREMFHDAGHSTSSSSSSPSLYCNPDPQLTCLKLGKRNYFEDLTPPPRFSMTKKSKSCGGAAADVAAPMCQVDGCAAVLVNAKDYHRRHKVCEMHAKAPKVVVVGIEQRFCQQCSRFHAVAEFDEAKRSCRRRLAGHNERRRKSSQEQNYLARKHHNDIEMMVAQPHLLSSSSECALSLLSPTNDSQWNGTSHDLPASCSAALRELIAENRASAFFACGQFINANHQTSWGPENRGHVTLNLMHGQDSGFGLRPGHSSEEDGDGDCPGFWNFPLGF